ncbi:DUF1905 domain-containing protein [Microbacterium sp. MC2]
MIVEFEGTVFLWDARTEAMFLVAVPAELSADIREIPRIPRGFGSVRVGAQIGGSRWRTSIFPDARLGEYVLPLKRAVREAEGFGEGDVVAVRLEILDG